jgi:hypothetical protein
MYLRTCFKERWRVCSKMERSEAPPAAAEVARPERSECPEKTAGSRPAWRARRLTILASWWPVIGDSPASLPHRPRAGNKNPSVIPDCSSTNVKVTQEDLAARLGVKPQQIQCYEASDYQTASFARLREIARLLGLGVRETVEWVQS